MQWESYAYSIGKIFGISMKVSIHLLLMICKLLSLTVKEDEN